MAESAEESALLRDAWCGMRSPIRSSRGKPPPRLSRCFRCRGELVKRNCWSCGLRQTSAEAEEGTRGAKGGGVQQTATGYRLLLLLLLVVVSEADESGKPVLS